MVNWESQRLPRHPRPHLRPPLRTGVPARPRRGEQRREARAGRDLPAQARRRRLQGRHARAPAEAGDAEERQAHRLRRRRPVVADRRARPRAARLPRHRVRGRSQGRRLHAHAGAALPPAGSGDRRGNRLHPRPRRRFPSAASASSRCSALLGEGLRRGVRRLRRAARARPRPAGPPGSRGQDPHRHRLAGVGLLRPCHRGRQARASCSAAATPRWTAAAPRAGSAATTSR